MGIANTVLKAAFDQGVHSITDIRLLAFIAAEAIDKGGVTDADMRRMSAALGFSVTAIWRSMTRLDELGYVQWTRSPARNMGSGTVRVVPSESSPLAA